MNHNAAHIAVLDDERRMAQILQLVLKRQGYEVDVFHDPTVFVATLDETRYDLVLTDLQMPKMGGLDVLRHIKTKSPETPVILITAHGTVASAVEAIREGAFDYVEKPFDNDTCVMMVKKALDVTALQRENQYLRAALRSKYALHDIIHTSKIMSELLALARRAAKSRATVLVTGESGTGKELFARTIHYHSERVGRPFVPVNCKALSSGVLESELFGHVKGAFTGASGARQGYFERAHEGTLFLDELGEIDLGFQAKLLRALQEKEIVPVGATEAKQVDVRIVAATNKNLLEEIEEGNFRQDLYFRLAVIPIHIPPLRERPEDILPLAAHFLKRWAEDMGRNITGWSPEVEQHLSTHAWPGNVRELENTIERAVVLAQGDIITMEDLLLQTPRTPHHDAPETLQQHLENATIMAIRRALVRSEGRRTEAAEKLDIDRTTLYRLMKKHGIE